MLSDAKRIVHVLDGVIERLDRFSTKGYSASGLHVEVLAASRQLPAAVNVCIEGFTPESLRSTAKPRIVIAFECPAGTSIAPNHLPLIESMRTCLGATWEPASSLEGLVGLASARIAARPMHDLSLPSLDDLSATVIVLAAVDAAADAIQEAVAKCGPGGLEKTNPKAVNKATNPSDLFRAVKAGDANAVRALVEAGASVHVRKPSRAGAHEPTALEIAAEHGHTDVARVLVDAGAEIQDALDIAVIKGHAQVAQMLLGSGVAVGARTLNAAARGGMSELVAQLLARGIRPDGETLELACWRCTPATVRALVDADASIGQALVQASARGDEAIVQLLLDRGATLNGKALYTAVCRGHDAVARMLISAGVDVNYRDPSAYSTALDCTRNEEIAALLRAAGGSKAMDLPP